MKYPLFITTLMLFLGLQMNGSLKRPGDCTGPDCRVISMPISMNY